MQIIELDVRLLAVTGENRGSVEDCAEGDGYRPDLLSFVDEDGRPLWDGKGMFSASVRDSLPEEAAVFKVSFALAVTVGDADEHDPGDWLVFSVEVY